MDPHRRGVLRYPDFICIGAQKAGTTWLDRNLRRHPRLWLPPVKELQYFSELYLPATRKWTTRHRVETATRILTRYIGKTPADEWDDAHISRLCDIASGFVSDEWYGRIFAGAADGKICGEITPDYSTIPEDGIRHIARLSPSVKIIFLMRDPIERSWSHIRMMAKARRITDVGELEAMARSLEQFRRADYTSLIRNWTSIIPRERFHTAFADDIAEAPHQVLEALCGFLGIRYQARFFRRAEMPVHVGEAQPMPPSVESILKERLWPAYEGIAAQFPEKGAVWLGRHFGPNAA
jgi:hypothetical protein